MKKQKKAKMIGRFWFWVVSWSERERERDCEGLSRRRWSNIGLQKGFKKNKLIIIYNNKTTFVKEGGGGGECALETHLYIKNIIIYIIIIGV